MATGGPVVGERGGFDRALRVALGRAIEFADVSVTDVAKRCGKTRQWLIRKIDPENPDPRPLTSCDVDEVLAAAGVRPAKLVSLIKDEINNNA